MKLKQNANVLFIFAPSCEVKPANFRYEHIFQSRDKSFGAKGWHQPTPCESLLIMFVARQKENFNLKARFLNAQQCFICGSDSFERELRISFKLVAKGECEILDSGAVAGDNQIGVLSPPRDSIKAGGKRTDEHVWNAGLIKCVDQSSDELF